MKPYFFALTILLSICCKAQNFRSGTYQFKYCDLEYNRCLASCKVVIKGNKITIYATKELSKAITNINEGDVIYKGLILKHTSGKWIIGKTKKDVKAKEIGANGPAIIDFRKREYWTF